VARHFNPHAVLRHLPVELVREYCGRENIPLPAGWDPPPAAASPLAAARRPRPDFAPRFEEVLLHAHQLGTRQGVAQLHDEAAFRNEPIPALDPEYGHQAVALWCMIHRGAAFHAVRIIDSAERLPNRYWHRTSGLPPGPPDCSPAARQRLRNAVSEYFGREEGRGQVASVEHYVRGGREHYFVCYCDDYTQTFTTHDANRRLARAPLRGTFEVVFAFDADDGVLDTYAPVKRAARLDLHDQFLSVALPTPPAEIAAAGPEYQLDRLLDRSRPLVTDPADGVTEVRVVAVTVAPPRSGRRLELRGDPNAGPLDALDALDEYFSADERSHPDLHLTAATFAVKYRRPTDDRVRSLTFRVSYPDTCTLKNEPDDRRRLGERLLRLWGIARA
jgi:hypothetical protein